MGELGEEPSRGVIRLDTPMERNAGDPRPESPVGPSHGNKKYAFAE